MSKKFSLLTIFALALSLISIPAVAQETATQEKKATTQEKTSPETKTEAKEEAKAPAPTKFKVAEGNIEFTATGAWTKVNPKVRFIEAEFSIPKVGADPKNGRLTIMGAGGTIRENVDRWKGQFKDTKAFNETPKKINGTQVTFVDITGTYIDSPGGPFAGGKKIERPNYRMRAAIIQTATEGNYFVKLYGAKPTIDANVKNFDALVNSIQVVQ